MAAFMSSVALSEKSLVNCAPPLRCSFTRYQFRYCCKYLVDTPQGIVQPLLEPVGRVHMLNMVNLVFDALFYNRFQGMVPDFVLARKALVAYVRIAAQEDMARSYAIADSSVNLLQIYQFKKAENGYRRR